MTWLYLGLSSDQSVIGTLQWLSDSDSVPCVFRSGPREEWDLYCGIWPPSREDLDIKIFTTNMSLWQRRAGVGLLVIPTTRKTSDTNLYLLPWSWVEFCPLMFIVTTMCKSETIRESWEQSVGITNTVSAPRWARTERGDGEILGGSQSYLAQISQYCSKQSHSQFVRIWDVTNFLKINCN